MDGMCIAIYDIYFEYTFMWKGPLSNTNVDI